MCQPNKGSFKKGHRPANYLGGIVYSKRDKRWFIRCRSKGCYPYAKAVLSCAIGRLLMTQEIVHHKDGDSTNDSLANLQIVTRAEHQRIHLPRKGTGGKHNVS